jgi:methionyl-tRNA formyltransferase
VKVLVCSPYPALLHPALEHSGDTYVDTNEEPAKWIGNVDFIICFGYRHIIRDPILSTYRDRIINIHISYLPWNRGADPNFWSWFDDTPKGVSIHYVNSGIDTGHLIEQWQCTKWISNETLRSSWVHLISTAKELFERRWHLIRIGGLRAKVMSIGGSYHKSADKEPFLTLLPQKWDTPVAEVERMGREFRDQHGIQDSSSWGR